MAVFGHICRVCCGGGPSGCIGLKRFNRCASRRLHMSLFRMSRRPTTRRSALVLTAVMALIGWFVVDVSAPAASSADLAPVVGSLTTEHMTNPLGIDTARPLLGWV